MIRQLSIWCIILSVVLSIAGCNRLDANKRLDHFWDTTKQNVVTADPLLFGTKAAYSDDEQYEWLKTAQDLLVEVQSIRNEKLTAENVERKGVLSAYLESCSMRESFLALQMPISHHFGPHLALNERFGQLPLSNDEEIAFFLESISESETVIGNLIDALESRRKNGILLPSFILRKVEDQCDSLYARQLQEHPIFTALRDSLNRLNFMTEETRKSFLTECEVRIKNSWIPSFKRLSAYLLQLEQSSVAVAGIWHLPNGNEFYQYTIRFYSGYEGNTDTLYLLAKQQLKILNGQIAAIDGLQNAPSSKRVPSNELMAVMNNITTGEKLFNTYRMLSEQKDADVDDQLQLSRQLSIATALLITDIGIHRKHWLRDQAIRFLENQLGSERQISEETVDRIIVQPGYYGKPAIVFLKLRELHEMATEDELNRLLRTLKLKSELLN